MAMHYHIQARYIQLNVDQETAQTQTALLLWTQQAATKVFVYIKCKNNLCTCAIYRYVIKMITA